MTDAIERIAVSLEKIANSFLLLDYQEQMIVKGLREGTLDVVEVQQEQQPEPIPEGVIYKASGNFFDTATNLIMDKKFREQWLSRKDEFPRK